MILDQKWIRVSAMFSSAVLLKGGLIMGGFFLGSWIDRKMHTPPLFMMLFVIIGAGLGLWWIIYIAGKTKN